MPNWCYDGVEEKKQTSAKVWSGVADQFFGVLLDANRSATNLYMKCGKTIMKGINSELKKMMRTDEELRKLLIPENNEFVRENVETFFKRHIQQRESNKRQPGRKKFSEKISNLSIPEQSEVQNIVSNHNTTNVTKRKLIASITSVNVSKSAFRTYLGNHSNFSLSANRNVTYSLNHSLTDWRWCTSPCLHST